MTQATNRPDLSGKRVLLRAPSLSDIQARFDLGNTREIHLMFGRDPDKMQPVSHAQAKAWVENQIAEPYAWIIEHESRMIGGVRLHSLDAADRRAIIAIGILDPSLLGKGLGTEVINLVVNFGFSVLRLHRLALRVLSFNTRAIAAYTKVGFVKEGRERQSARIAGEWHDDIIMGLLAPDHAKASLA